LAARAATALLFAALAIALPLQADDIADSVREGRSLVAQGDAEGAYAVVQDALATALRTYTEPHVYHAIIRDDLAKIAFALARHREALQHADAAVHTYGSLDVADAGTLWQFRGTRAAVLARLGRHPEAIDILQAWFDDAQARGDAIGSVTAARALAVALAEFDRATQALPLLDQILAAAPPIGESGGDAHRDALGLVLDVRLAAGQDALAVDGARELLELQRFSAGGQTAAGWIRLGKGLVALSRLDEAEAALQRARTVGGVAAEGSLDVATIDYECGLIATLRGDAVLAESLFSSALDGFLATTSKTHPAVLRALHGLALSNKNLGRFVVAERFFDRVIQTTRDAYGEAHPALVSALSERALLHIDANRPEAALTDALAASDRLQAINPTASAVTVQSALVQNILGFAHQALGLHQEAIDHLQRGTDQLARTRGEASSDLPPGYTALARSHLALGDRDAASDFAKRAVRIARKDRSTSATRLARALGAQASVEAASGRCERAATVVDEALRVIARLDGGPATLIDESVLARARTDRGVIAELLAVLNGCDLFGRGHTIADAALVLAVQLPQLTATSGAVAALQGRERSPRTAQLIKQRQDLLERLRATGAEHRTAASGNDVTSASLARLYARDVATRAAIVALDEQIEVALPGYRELMAPSARPVEAIRAGLRADEVLLMQLTDASRTYLVAMTSTDVRTAVAPASANDLAAAVEAIRSGLDLQSVRKLRELAPFDVAAAYRLYAWLLAPFEPLIDSATHLIFAFDGAMQRLPPALLLRTPAEVPGSAFDHTRLPYLVKSHATSVVPSAGALLTLRAVSDESVGPRRFLGVGDPAFEDLSGSGTRGVERAFGASGVRVDADQLRGSFDRLTETADELRAMAQVFGEPESLLLLQGEASESRIKSIDLSTFGIIAFATHALMAGELAAVAEPSLVFTPPARTSVDDDGLLSASEVAALELRADWVILSACNTASPDATLGADGLSGLSRAFFHAGARSLLVTHWWVDSRASQILTTRTAQGYAATDRGDKAQSLREAMLYLVSGENEGPSYAHPALWAPFVLVGDRY